MISEPDKTLSISRIIHSDELKDAKIYQDLLSYLYKATQKGEAPKEVTIAQEVFGIKEFDAERDAKIRVYVYNLRKKLDSYYLHEGKNDKVEVSIQKGLYLLEFYPSSNQQKKYLPKRYILYTAFFLLIALGINPAY